MPHSPSSLRFFSFALGAFKGFAFPPVESGSDTEVRAWDTQCRQKKKVSGAGPTEKKESGRRDSLLAEICTPQASDSSYIALSCRRAKGWRVMKANASTVSTALKGGHAGLARIPHSPHRWGEQLRNACRRAFAQHRPCARPLHAKRSGHVWGASTASARRPERGAEHRGKWRALSLCFIRLTPTRRLPSFGSAECMRMLCACSNLVFPTCLVRGGSVLLLSSGDNEG